MSRLMEKQLCLEASRNGRLCAGAEWYERRIEELQAQVDRICTWTKVDLSYSGYEPDAWNTSCGEDFAIIEEWHNKPTKFCQSCGGKVIEAAIKGEAE